MSAKDVTRVAVLRATAEFDQLGERNFLSKYGFGRARDYVLVHNGREYPSKAIIGAAHGHTGDGRQPLGPTDFSGGAATVQPILEALGFQVLARSPQPVSGAASIYWVNQGKTYEKARTSGHIWAPKEGENGVKFEHWSRVARLQPEDLVIHYSEGAIRALGRVKASPYEHAEEQPDGKTWRGIGWRTDIEYFDIQPPVRLQELDAEFRRVSLDGGPFDKNGDVKQGYLYNFSKAGLLKLKALRSLSWPPWASGEESLSQVESTSVSQSDGSIFDFLQAKGLRFPRELVTSYLLSLQTKPFVILSGISGTGKTKLAQAVAEWAGREERQVEEERSRDVHWGPDVWRYTMSPYTLDHRKILVARDAIDLFRLPEQGSERIKIQYGGQQYEGTFGKVMSKGRELYELRLGVPLTTRLRADVKVGERLNIRVTREGEAQGVVFIDPDAAPVPTRREVVVRHTFISVRPDWLDRKGLLGFYNLLSEEFVVGPFLERALAAFADEPQGKPHFVTLDEMNLARVEHYFADVLSVLESRQGSTAEGITQESIELHSGTQCVPLDEMATRPTVCNGCRASDAAQRQCTLRPDGIRMVPPRLKLPTNLFVTGTVNVDETTHMFSPKVLDRANVLEFNSVHLSSPPPDSSKFVLRNGSLSLAPAEPARFDDFVSVPPEAKEILSGIHALLEPFHLHFGYRVANEIGLWLRHAAAAVGNDRPNVLAAVDLQVLQKVLPKLHGSKQQLQRPLWALVCFAVRVNGAAEFTSANLGALSRALAGESAKFIIPGGSEQALNVCLPRSAAKLNRMFRRLLEQGFVSFIE